ncbi:MAG TPA: phosphonopyruvate decarboxylase [Acetobacteraceae bacterium]
MIEADAFLDAAAARGIRFYAGVPCSYLTPLINRVASRPGVPYVGAASEGEAVAIAAGAWLGGQGAAVMMQNSGLGNAVNPLTSLNHPFRIPALLVVTWRGEPGRKDEPQHTLMGRATGALLDTIEVPHGMFPQDPAAIAPALDAAAAAMAEGRPYALVMHEGSVGENGLDEPARPALPSGERTDLRRHGDRPARAALLERLLAALPSDVPVVATTGKCGRELFTLADREQHLYQVGSMGCASGMGLGVALATGRRVVVLDGDGAALMKLGTMATIGAQQPPGLLHVLLDNGVHDSTGGQATVSPGVDFPAVALACGYRAAWACDDAPGFETALRAALAIRGPVLVHVRIRPGSMASLGRPTVAPHEVARRFKAFLARPGTAA